MKHILIRLCAQKSRRIRLIRRQTSCMDFELSMLSQLVIISTKPMTLSRKCEKIDLLLSTISVVLRLVHFNFYELMIFEDTFRRVGGNIHQMSE